MGRDRYRIQDPAAPHFVTCTVLEWLPLFAQPANAQILLDSLQFLQERDRLTLHGYVILENHCHLVVRSPDLPKVLYGGKNSSADEKRKSRALRLLALHKARHKVDRDYPIWQEGSHPEQIEGEAMMRQKVSYRALHKYPLEEKLLGPAARGSQCKD